MTPDALAAFADRHGLTEAARAELARLLGHPDALTTLTDTRRQPDPGSATFVGVEEPAPAPEIPLRDIPGDRYGHLGPIGAGGMGEVHRVRDLDLGRVVAMKIIAENLLDRPIVLRRFSSEARTTAQLQHPAIVPVHELGRLPDGRPFFTMQEVRGQTLEEVIREVHAASRGPEWGTGATGWTFRRLVDVYRQVCEAVAYAHARGVIHRDLKPQNIMVGRFGEVFVMDWGLAKHLEVATEDTHGAVPIPLLSTGSRAGQVVGTPAYMPPEQARGELELLSPASDVYALGAVLYELLTGRPPYEGSTGAAVLRQVLSGPPEPASRRRRVPTTTFSFVDDEPPDVDGPPLPEELVRLCEIAMSREAHERFPDASALAAEVTAWLDGARRREQAQAVVRQADALVPEVEALRARAAALARGARSALAEIPTWAPPDEKAPHWTALREATALELRADLQQLQVLQALSGALTIEPSLPDAHARLAAHFRARHEAAEALGDRAEAARNEIVLGYYTRRIPVGHPDRARHLSWLDGTGRLTLITQPPGARAELARVDTDAVPWREVPERDLGLTPRRHERLPHGSWIVTLSAPGRRTVRLPVRLAREGGWPPPGPDGRAPPAVRLPREAALDADDCVVPAGWFVTGGDPLAPSPEPARRVWVDDLVIERFPVTNRRYLAFLDALVAGGREADALRFAPRQMGTTPEEPGALIYGRDGPRFALVPDADGDVWDLDAPVLLVDWFGAVAFARWRAEETGLPWRLPTSLEREKAGRGTDGRPYPWGDVFDPSLACTRDSHAGRRLPARVTDFPWDESVYGVRGLAGNVRDWCLDGPEDTLVDASGRHRPPSPGAVDPHARRCERGGFWNGYESHARLAHRRDCVAGTRVYALGFRLARSLLPEEVA